MRYARIAALLGVVAALPLPIAHAALAAAASSLFEAVPFLLAASLLGSTPAAEALRCGCGGRGARSLPAAVLCAMSFGWPIALGRLGAGWLLPTRHRTGHPAAVELEAFGELERLFPAALVGGFVGAVIPGIAPELAAWPFPAALACGAAAAALSRPCGLGTVALAAGLRQVAPGFAYGWLAFSGIISVRWPSPKHGPVEGSGRPEGTTLLTIALAAAGLMHGATLVNPRFAPALLLGAGIVWQRRAALPNMRSIVPALMLFAAIVSSPPVPPLAADVTNLADAYPGQPLSFTGQIVQHPDTTLLVRSAITCCRADASPITLALSTKTLLPAGTWVRADGILVTQNGKLALRTTSLRQTPPPIDPYLYR